MQKKLGAGEALCFLNTKMLLIDSCLCICHLDCVCACIFIYIYTHSYLPTSACIKIRIFPQPASSCTLQKYRQKNKVKSLTVAKSSETNIAATGHCFFPELSPLPDPNLMILSIALYILLFIRNNIQSSLDSICRAAESSAAERW